MNTEEWFDIQRRINRIINSQLESDEAVMKVETEESQGSEFTIVLPSGKG